MEGQKSQVSEKKNTKNTKKKKKKILVGLFQMNKFLKHSHEQVFET